MIKMQSSRTPRNIMQNRTIIAAVLGCLLMFGNRGIPADQNDAKRPSNAQAKADLEVLVGKIQAKISEGKKTEKDLAEEVKEFDVLLAKYKGQKTDDVAKILLMKATLYLEIFDD